MKRRMLPVGIQAFRDLRERGCYYVDKAEHLRKLIREGKHYFHSRPRCFGKSLLASTLKELFEGNEALYRGLHIHSHWDWSVRRPALRLSFDYGHFDEPGALHTDLLEMLDDLAEATGVEIQRETGPGRFAYLIRMLHRRSGRKVAVLVDE